MTIGIRQYLAVLTVVVVSLTGRAGYTAEVKVVDHGADPSGQNDSTVAIRESIREAGEGGTVVFDSGIYLVGLTSGGNVQFPLFDGLTLQGDSATIRCAPPAPAGPGCRPFYFGDQLISNVTFDGLRFEDFTIAAIRLTNSRDVTIQNNVFGEIRLAKKCESRQIR